MSSDTDRTDGSLARWTEDGVSPGVQHERVTDRLRTLSEKLSVCDTVLNDLKDLSDILVRKSLQDLTLPSQK
ncbi:hypothetical protein JOB18_010081 [Solea senegalensis]|nr:hypothetical protein JOB18_010081 [Solea senegalensis]